MADESGPNSRGAIAAASAANKNTVDAIAVLGKTTMQVSQILKLGRGAIVELDKHVGGHVDILVNQQLITRGELVVDDDDKHGVSIIEVVIKGKDQRTTASSEPSAPTLGR
jgi:flagellar motor switch protein FliN/FliY